MKQNIISVNTLFKYYRIVQYEFIQQYKEEPLGELEPLFIISFRRFKKFHNEFESYTLVSWIEEYLRDLKYPTARTEKIRAILGL